jgi:hypothetical protein
VLPPFRGELPFGDLRAAPLSSQVSARPR